MPRNNTTSSRPAFSKSNYSYSRPTSNKPNVPSYIPPKSSVPTYTPSTVPSINIGQPTMWDSVKQGFGFGVGSSIARNIFSSKDEVKVVHETSSNNKEYCLGVFESYQKCITEGTCSDDLVNHLKSSYDKCKTEQK